MIVACVSDSYDVFNAIKMWSVELKQQIIDSGATLVIRLDSGDPVEIVVKALKMLDEGFGSKVNSKGYKVLNYVRALQGDGINEDSINEIIEAVLRAGFSLENLVFGCGAGMVQDITRDYQKFAQKMSSITVDGEEREVFKDPVTDPGKRSKGGRLDTVKWANGKWSTIKLTNGIRKNEFSAMRTVYLNGKLMVDETFDRIRERALAQ